MELQGDTRSVAFRTLKTSHAGGFKIRAGVFEMRIGAFETGVDLSN